MKSPISPPVLISFFLLLCSLIFATGGCNLDTHPEGMIKGSKAAQINRNRIDDSTDFEERFIAAREHASRGDYDQAYDVLWDISEKSPTEMIGLRADIELCRTLEKLNRKDEAFYKRNAAIARLKELIDTETPELGYVMLLAESYAAKQDLDAAEKIIDNSRLDFTDEQSQQKVSEVASKIHARRAGEIMDISNQDGFDNKLNSVSKALVFDALNKEAQYQLIRYFVFANLDEDQLMWLTDAAIDGAEPAIARIAIGVRDALRKNNASASKSFRIARESLAQTGQLINELTDYMIKSKSLPETELLGLVNTAIETCPDELHLLRTRASLEMELGHYQDAAQDFEKYIDGVPDEFCIWSHQLLIEAQKKIGQPEIAKEREQDFSRIVATLSPAEQQRVQRIMEDVNKRLSDPAQD